MKKIVRIVPTMVAIVLAIALFANLATAGSSLPADKAAANGSTVKEFSPGTDVTLLSLQMKTSTPEDLIIQFTAECSILTSTTTGGPMMSTDTQEATGDIQVWATFDGAIVPINSTSTPPQPWTGSTPGSDSDKVTLCSRDQKDSVTDTEDNTPMDGTDERTAYLNTKEANGFQWVWLNAGNQVHTIEIHATLANTATGTAQSSAYVGNRVLVVDPTKFANTTTV